MVEIVHDPFHFLIGNKGGLQPGGLGGSVGMEKTVSPAKKLLCSAGIQNDPAVYGRTDGKGSPAGDVGLDKAGDDIGRGTLGSYDQVDTCRTAQLGYPADGIFHLIGCHHHQVR